MRDVATHTRVGPAQRIEKLLQFNRRVQSNNASIDAFRDYSLELGRNLVDINARQLPTRLIQLGQERTEEPRNADWTSAFQGKHQMFRTVPLKRWSVVIPSNLSRDADDFLKMLMKVAAGMKFDIGPPSR